MRGRRFAVIIVVLLAHASMSFAPIAQAAPKLSGYALPWRAGVAHAIRGSWYNQNNHKGMERYALDWDLSYEPVLAAKAGRVVIAVRTEHDPGPAICFDKDNVPNKEEQKGFGNFLVVDHGDGVQSLYAHLSKVSVYGGQYVRRGKKLGISGNTGKSCGPHLHFRMTRRGIPIKPEPMSGYRAFPNNHVRLYVAHGSTWVQQSGTRARPAPNASPRPKPRALAARKPIGRFVELARTLSASAPTSTAGETVTLTYTAVAGTVPQNIGVFAVRLGTPDDQRLVLPCSGGENRTLAPGAEFSCTVTQHANREGTYWMRAGWLDRQGQWQEPAAGQAVSFTMYPRRLEIVDPARVSSGQAGMSSQVSFTVRNPAAVPIEVSRMYVRLWKPSGDTEDVACETATGMTLDPSKQFTCIVAFAARTPGTYGFQARWYGSDAEQSNELGVVQTFEIAGST